MTRSLLRLSIILLAAVVMVACGDTPTETAPPAPVAAGQPDAAPLPSGHPPVGGGTGGLAGPSPDSGTGSNALNWQPPEGWGWVQPANTMRRAQYNVPGAAGDGECVVYYFGPGQGGDAMSNATRWANQFSQPDGSPSVDIMKTESIMVGDMPVLLIEVTGSYGGGMPGTGAGGAPKTDQMLLGAVAEGPDANWFFKLTGPQATVGEQREAFEGMIRSLTAGGDEI